MKRKAEIQTVPNWQYAKNNWLKEPPTYSIKQFIISAVVTGSANPLKVQWPESLINGDFVIGANCNEVPDVGDGVDEHTAWDFDFREDANWRKIFAIRELDSVLLNLTFIGAANAKSAGIQWFSKNLEFSGKYHKGLFSDIQTGHIENIEIELFNRTDTTPIEILHVILLEPAGMLRFHIADDLLITKAKCTIQGKAYMK